MSAIATPDEINDDEFELAEFFVVRLYSKTCNTKELNETRGILFSRDNKLIGNISPTKGALRQHDLRSVLQSSKFVLCVKALMVGMLANKVRKKYKTKQYRYGMTCHRPQTYAENLVNVGAKKDIRDDVNF